MATDYFQDDKIIEDMYIPGGSDRYVMKGYEVVKRTIEGVCVCVRACAVLLLYFIRRRFIEL